MLCWRFPALYNIGSHLPFTIKKQKISKKIIRFSWWNVFRDICRMSCWSCWS